MRHYFPFANNQIRISYERVRRIDNRCRTSPALAAYDDDDRIDFSGLDYCRLKARGDKLVMVEFE